jgi:hypothetical protein
VSPKKGNEKGFIAGLGLFVLSSKAADKRIEVEGEITLARTYTFDVHLRPK